MKPLLLLAALLAACSRARERPSQRANVLLITIDTLRADRLSCAGYHRATTPNLDRLAAEGLRFTHAQSPRAKTTPAIASLMSGLYPHDHGARENSVPVDRGRPLLAERLREAGWRTGAIVGNYVLLDRHSGLARGFDLWCEDLPQRTGVPPDDAPQRTARSLTDGALAALGLEAPSADGAGPTAPFVREGQPWFLWLHYMDPHGAYDPPAEHRVFASPIPEPLPEDPGYRPGDLHRFTVAKHNLPDSCRMSDGLIDAAAVRDLYDGEVRYADAEIGRLLDALRARGLLDRTLVVVTADHGESLGEHRYWFEHGLYAYETTCRVPLLVRAPPAMGIPPGVRRSDIALADLAPTILDLLGLPGTAGETRGARGVPRTALLRAEDPRAHPVFSEKIARADLAGTVQAKAVRIGDWKLIRRYALRDGQGTVAELSEELYDLAADPGETRNLAGSPPATAPLDRLRAELLRFASADVRFGELARLLQRERERLERTDREALRILESLGY